jgi:RHS repeat-associated protein
MSWASWSGEGGILYSLRGGVPSFTHYNRRGDVTSKTDATGAVTYQAEYEAFGKRTNETGATLDRQKSNSKDEDIPGYANEGFRFRDLETGSFITRDPAGFVDGPNLYTYVNENPWTKFDPEGLSWMDVFAPATASTVGPSPYGGERGAMEHSAQITRPVLGLAAATGSAVTAAPVVMAATTEAAPAVATGATTVALAHPAATVAVAESAIVGGIVYHETGDLGAAVSSAGLTGLSAYANGAGGKPSSSAKDTKAEANAAVITVDAKKYPQSAAHIQEAQEAGQPSVLTVDRTAAAANRKAALKGTPVVEGLDRDEYPPAMFSEGGAGASVKAINPSDNRGAGGSIGQQAKKLANGTKVKIQVVNNDKK